MVDYVFLSDAHNAEAIEAVVAFHKGGLEGPTSGWVVPTTDTLVVHLISGMAAGPYEAFGFASSSGLDVTIDTGEAMIEGSPVARDTQTTVTLSDNLDNQTVYAGYQPQTNDELTIGLDADFTANHSRIPIWDFDTSGGEVTGNNSRRILVEHINVQNRRYETSDGTGTAVDAAEDSNNLGGQPAGNYARTDQSETFAGPLTVSENQDTASLTVLGSNDVDADVVVIDGDADAGQDDDLLKVRSVDDPSTTDPTDSDTILVMKGDGRLGVNTFSPSESLDVSGTANITGATTIGGDVTMSGGQLIVEGGGTQLVIRETDSGHDWLLEGQAGQFRITEQGVNEWFRIDDEQNNRCEMPGGAATQFMTLDVRDSEPPITQTGTMAMQDGVNWDPAGTGELDLVVRIGSNWVLLS